MSEKLIQAAEFIKTSSVEDAVVYLSAQYGVSHVTYHLALSKRITTDDPFVRTTYPEEWVARYLLKGYVQIDPVFQQGLRQTLPFDWRELTISAAAMGLMRESIAFGLGPFGYSIPLTDKVGRRALFSLNQNMNEVEFDLFLQEFKDDFLELGQLLHTRAIEELFGSDPEPDLSARELECLSHSATGKSRKEIAHFLGLSEHTVKAYHDSARHKLNCASLAAAIAIAAQRGLLGRINLPQ